MTGGWSVLRRYGIAVIAVVLAVATMRLPEIGKGAGSVFFLAVLISAWYGGLGPGLFATGLTTSLAVAGMVLNRQDFEAARAVSAGLFAAGGVTITLLIEALHAARRRVEASQKELSAVLTSIGDAVIATDAQGRVTFTNPVADSLTGWGQKEASGMPLETVFRIISEKSRQRVDNPVDRVLAEGTVVGLANHTLLISRDGSERPIADCAAPVRGQAGDITGVVLVFRDVTEQKHAESLQEENFRREQEHTRCLWELARISTRLSASLDVESALGVVSEEARNLISVAHVSATSDPAEAPELPGAFDVPLTGRGGQSLGLIRVAGSHEGEFGEQDRAILGQLGHMASNAIENARLYQELRANDRRKDQFLAMLAHELRNPLAAINNAVLLSTRSGLQENREWSMDVVNRQIRHLSRLIDDLLDVSRITTGKIRLRRELCDIVPLLDYAVGAVRALVEERNHDLQVEVIPQELWVEGDPLRLEQVFTNLLNNAAKYSESGGRIRVIAASAGDSILVRFQDTGVGMSPELVPRVFDLFAQGDRSLARSEGGLGIGLTLVKTLTDMHGGSVTASSVGPGYGSEFVVRLPAAAAPAPAPAPEDKLSSPGESPARGKRILVVDDNRDLALGMSRLLSMVGHTVQTVYNGPAAIEAARESLPEVVLLDIGLPGMDGYEVAANLRTVGEGNRPLIVAVTGYGHEDDVRRSLESGFDYHLVKPVDHNTLLLLLEKAGSSR